MKRIFKARRFVAALMIIAQLVWSTPGVFAGEYYAPYVSVVARGGGGISSSASVFLPIAKADDYHSLAFADIRFFGKGQDQDQQLSANFGYRHLFSERHMFGAYTYIDALAESGRHPFSRMGLGAEYQNNRFFIKGSAFTPLGDAREDRVLYEYVPSYPTFASAAFRCWSAERTRLVATEVVLRGVEGDMGYALTDRLNIQAGGYAATGEGPGFERSALHAGLVYKVGDGLSVQARRYLAKKEGSSFDAGISYNWEPPTTRISNVNIGIGYEQPDNQEGRGFVQLSFDLGSPVKSVPVPFIMDRGMAAHISRTVPLTVTEANVIVEPLSWRESACLFERSIQEHRVEAAIYLGLLIATGAGIVAACVAVPTTIATVGTFAGKTLGPITVSMFLGSSFSSPAPPVIPDYKVRPGPFANKLLPEMSYNSQEEKEEK